MTGRGSQKKGRAAEIELANYLQGRGYDVHVGKSKSFGEEPDIFGIDNLHLEVKRCEQLKIPAWLEQAERDSKRFQDGLPVVVFRRNYEPWNVTMRLTDFLSLYERGNRA